MWARVLDSVIYYPHPTTYTPSSPKQTQGLTKDDVDLLLLSGAAARVPKLQAWLQGEREEEMNMYKHNVMYLCVYG